MSTAVMGLCWPLQMSPTPKAVLISLADQANDQGACWPSLAGLVTRTCFGRTAVIESIKWLESGGYLSIEKCGGRTNRYSLDLNRLRHRATEPVRHADQSGRRTSSTAVPPPVRQADQPVRQTDLNRQEPSTEPSKRSARTRAETMPTVEVMSLVACGFSEQQAIDFISYKRQMKAPLTERAWKDHLRESEKAGWTPADAAEKVMAKSWRGFEAKYVADAHPSSPTRESAYQRAQRERMAEFAPSVAARAPGQSREIVDVEVVSH